MAKSDKQIQQEFLDNPALLEELSKLEEIGTKNLPVTERYIIAKATAFVKKVQENLKKLNKIDTGTLEKDVSQGELINNAGVYEIEIGYPKGSKAAEYYDYVNKGVKGFKSGRPRSPYSFKSAFPKINGPMVAAIQKWVKRNALAQRRETQKYNLSRLQKKRKAISELNTGRTTAYLIARKIKQKGLPKTGFFDDAIQEYFGYDFAQNMAKIIGADIRVGVKQVNNLINEKNK